MLPNGRFRFILPDKTKLIVPNAVVSEGKEAYLKMLMQGNNVIVAAGANFYMGLCAAVAATLADIATEPTVTNGYARSAIIRSAVGWPTIEEVAGQWMAQSTTETFTASGGAFSTTFTRAFLCSVSAGTGGILFAMSAALPSAITLGDGQSFSAAYELFLG